MNLKALETETKTVLVKSHIAVWSHAAGGHAHVPASTSGLALQLGQAF